MRKKSNFGILQESLHATYLLQLLDKIYKYELDPMSIVEDTERTRLRPRTSWRKTQLYCHENRWRFFCLLRIIQKSELYQLGVPQGQGDSSAPSTTDPLICGFCLVTTSNTRGKTVEQSVVTRMFAREFITNNRHPGEPQLTNKPCTNGRLGEKHNCIVMRIDEDSSAYSESFTRVECTNWEYRRVRVTHQLPVPQMENNGRTRWNLLCLSVRPSVCPSVNFVEARSIVTSHYHIHL